MQFVVTKTTNQTFGVEAETPQDGMQAFRNGNFVQITAQESLNVQPRPSQTLASAVPPAPQAPSRVG